jgi:hypothetical protein
LRFRLGHYLPRDAKAINYNSVSLGEKCFQQRDLDLTAIVEGREEPFGLAIFDCRNASSNTAFCP